MILKRIALSAVLSVGLAGAAMAQYSEPMGLSVRGGFFRGSNLAFGLEYKIRDARYGMSNPGYSQGYSLSLDWYERNGERNMPLLFNYVARNDQVFYSGGAGIGFADGENEFTYQLGIGYDFTRANNPFFVELKYFGTTDASLNGFGIYGGVRF